MPPQLEPLDVIQKLAEIGAIVSGCYLFFYRREGKRVIEELEMKNAIKNLKEDMEEQKKLNDIINNKLDKITEQVSDFKLVKQNVDQLLDQRAERKIFENNITQMVGKIFNKLSL